MIDPHRTTIVAPLAYEQAALRRALRGSGPTGWPGEIVRSGPGATAVERAVATLGALDAEHRPTTLVLAGLAGGLDPSLRAGDAVIAARVVTGERSSVVEPSEITLGVPEDAPVRSGTIVTVTEIVGTPEAKRTLRGETGGDVVDCESLAFVAAARTHGFERTIVVRGIGDDAATALPPTIGSFVDDDGRTRVAVVLSSILRRETSLPALRTLHRDGARAIEAVAAVIRALAASGRSEGSAHEGADA